MRSGIPASLALLLFFGPAFAQEGPLKARTEDGRVVILNPNGTWRFDVDVPPPPDEAFRPPAASKWKTGGGASKMDDSPTIVYYLSAESGIRIWLKTYRPALFARCREGKTDVFLAIGGAASIETGGGHTVRVRFDDRPAFVQSWSESTDGETLFAPDPKDLMRRMAEARRMLIQFIPFNAAPAVAEFDVRGFDERIGKLAETCHWRP